MDVKLAEQKYGIKLGSRVNHPMFGLGEVRKIVESGLSVKWDNPYYRIKGPVLIEEADIVFMTKVITEEKTKMAKKMVLEFDLPDPKDSTFTSMDPMSKGTAAPLATLDGNGKPGLNWKPTLSKDPKDAPGAVKVAGGKAGSPVKTSAPEKASAPVAPKSDADDSSDDDSEKKENPFAKKVEEMTWTDLVSLSGGVVAESEDEDEDEDDKPGRKDRQARRGSDKKRDFEKKYGKELDECDDKEQVKENDMDQMMNEHDMASGEIAMTKDLMKAILAAAVANPPDEAGQNKIAQAFCDASAEIGDRTLDVSDIGTIMSKIKEVAGGEQDLSDDVSPVDGETAGDEGGEEHEGKDMLMAGQKRPVRDMFDMREMDQAWTNIKEWLVGAIGAESRYNPEATRIVYGLMKTYSIEEDQVEEFLDRFADPTELFSKAKLHQMIQSSINSGKKVKSKKKINEAWLAAIPNTAVIGVNNTEGTQIEEGDDEDTQLFKLIAYRAGVNYKG